MRNVDAIDTELPDLSEFSLHDVAELGDDRIEAFMRAIYPQIDRPRTNLGSSGPPGRAD